MEQQAQECAFGSKRIVVAGAGSIGCFTGGLLAASGRQVTFLARPRIIEELSANGLLLTDYAGMSVPVDTSRISLSDAPDCLEHADIVVVAVKSRATAGMAELIAQFAPPTATIVSYQNGVTNGNILRDGLPGHDVIAAMVPFNVVANGAGRFHRATSGDIAIGQGCDGLADTLSAHGMKVCEHADIASLQWGKLLINLNNALNALSGLPLQQQLLDRGWRRLMADQMQEALDVLRVAGIRASSTTAVPVALIPRILRLPTPLFRRVAARMLTVDPEARLSMWDDLEKRRPTEIDVLQGTLQALALRHSVPTPVIDRISAAVRAAEAAAVGSPGMRVEDIRRFP